jgi:hypothetical protein
MERASVMAAAGGVREASDWRAAAPILECLAACKDWPPSISTFKCVIAGAWKPVGVWQQREDAAQQLREAMPTVERLRKGSGMSKYHDAILAEILDALAAAGYVQLVHVDSKNKQHFAPMYRGALDSAVIDSAVALYIHPVSPPYSAPPTPVQKHHPCAP